MKTHTEEQTLKHRFEHLTLEELEAHVNLISPRIYPETCIHEASHAVFAAHLGVPFEYVTVRFMYTESGDLRLGHVKWTDQLFRATKDLIENYALALLAPQIVLACLGIERTVEEATEEFSGDEAILDIFLQFKPDMDRTYLRKKAEQFASPTIVSEIQAISEELKSRKILTRDEVLERLKCT